MIDAALDAALPSLIQILSCYMKPRDTLYFPEVRDPSPPCVICCSHGGSGEVWLSRFRSTNGIVEAKFACCSCNRTYTFIFLVHDDLPSMDNDDFRRGVPTVHKAFGEAEAILVGDALLSLAFEVVSKEETVKSVGSETLLKIAHELACASGSLGMVGGQLMDISPFHPGIGGEYIEKLSDRKTGALMRAAIRCGALVAGADSCELDALTRFESCSAVRFRFKTH